MDKLKFSIALCTYNGAAYLSVQLDSLLAQTRLPDEVVISDDASSDATWSLLEAFALKARALGVYVRLQRRLDNVGFIANFSDVLMQTTGDIVCLCDQDDLWLPEKLTTLETDFIQRPALTLLCSDATLVNAAGAPLGHTLFEALELAPFERDLIHTGRGFDVLLRRSMVTGATAAFRRELIALALPVPDAWIHDEWLAIVAAATGSIDLLPRPLIDYRQHGANQIGARKRGLKDKWRDLICSRATQMQAETRRSEQLAARLSALASPVPAGLIEQIERRRLHFEARFALGAMPRARRLTAVMREASSGNYSQYGTRARAMLRDILRRD